MSKVPHAVQAPPNLDDRKNEEGLSRRLQFAAQFREGNQLSVRLIPQDQAHTLKALEQGDASDRFQLGKIAQHFRQTVKRNAAAKMVYMVHSDICGQPMQSVGKIVKRASV